MCRMNPLDSFDRAAAAAAAVISGIAEDQFDLPTPCTEWTVRGVVNHLVGGNAFAVTAAAGQPPPDRSLDRVGADPKAAFAESIVATRAALADPGLAERTVRTPIGEQPGVFLVHMRVAELLAHGWDLARATGQSTDLEPDLAEQVLAQWQARLGDGSREGTPFGPATQVPATAPAADRLAGFLGRKVTD